MNNKEITFHSVIKKTAKKQPVDTAWCVFADDYNSVQVKFVVSDLTPSEIHTVTPTVILIMEDGSRIQRTKEQLTQHGERFGYTLKDKESQHIGVVKAQLKLETLTGETYMSNIYTFTILESLDSVPVPKEFVIDDIRNILQEVKHHITHVFKDEIERERVFKEYVANIQLSEKQRETWFNQSQQTRASLFQVFMDEAQEVLKDAQQVKDLFDELTETGIIETNIREKLGELETSYAPRLSTLEQNDVSLTAQLQHKVDKTATDLSINMFNESDRAILQGLEPGQINAVLGPKIVRPENTSFFVTGKNLYDKNKRRDGWRINTAGEVTQEGLASSYSTSAPMYVVPGKKLVVSDGGITWGFNRLVSYDSSGNKVDVITSAFPEYTVPENVVSVIFSGAIDRMANGLVQVEYETVTAFSPYQEFIDTDFLNINLMKEHDTFFVSTNGSDSNDGLSKDYPFATFSKAISNGAKTIYAKRGEYLDQKIVASNTKELNVFPYGDGEFVTLRPSTESPLPYPVDLQNVEKINISAIKVINAGVKGFRIWGCNGELFNCVVDQSTSDGFSLDGSNLKVHNSEAINCIRDGFNIHEFVTGTGKIVGYTEFYDCKAIGNGDDGISHHESCSGSIYGGEYKNNVSGGVTPFGQAVVSIQNAVIEGNGQGIHAFQSTEIGPNPTIHSSTNLIKDNAVGIMVNNYNLISINDKLINNTTRRTRLNGTITSY